MKKILLTLIILATAGLNSISYGADFGSFKNPFKKQPVTAQDLSSDEDYSKSEQAIIYYNENNIKKALETLMSIKDVERRPIDWLLLGNILQDENRTTDAIFMYQRAITLDPKNYKAYYNLGNIYLEDEKPFLAIENYRKANKANNKFAYAYYNLGCAYLKTGNLKKAKIAFLKAIELKNNVPDFHYNLAFTYKRLNNEKLAKQYLEFYNKLINNN